MGPGTERASYDLLRGIEILGRLALEKMLAGTEIALAELMSRRLEDLDLVAFMVDGGPSSYPHASPPLRT